MDLYEVMRTTFAAREFTDEPVPIAVLERMLDNARFAPSGGNRQGWNVIVVREPDTREALIPLIEPTMRRYLAQVDRGEAPFNTIRPSAVTEAEVAARQVPDVLVRRLVHAPLLLVVTVDLGVVASFDSALNRVGVISGASIYPFVWNLLLAARNEGYGGTLTTFLVGEEPAAKALLGIPDHVAIAAMLPIGRPVRQLTRLRRKRVPDILMLDRWQSG